MTNALATLASTWEGGPASPRTFPDKEAALRSFVTVFLSRAPPWIALSSALRSPVGAGAAIVGGGGATGAAGGGGAIGAAGAGGGGGAAGTASKAGGAEGGGGGAGGAGVPGCD